MTSSLQAFDFLVDRVRLARQKDHRPVAVVEGKSDRRLLERLFGREAIAVYIAGGRDGALRAARDMEAVKLRQAVSVVDVDFDNAVDDGLRNGWPIVAYDNADLESMLWHGASLAVILEELGSDEKLERFGGVDCVRSAVVDVLRPLSRLRAANAAHGWGIRFDDLDLSSKVDRRSLAISVQSVCDSLWSRSLPCAKHDLYEAAVDSRYDRSCASTRLSLIRGRDALAVLAVALRSLIGTARGGNAPTAEHLEKTLRLAATEARLEETVWLPSLKHELALP